MRTLLDGEPNLEVIAEADGGQGVLELSRLHRPHLVLMGAGTPRAGELEAIPKDKRGVPRSMRPYSNCTREVWLPLGGLEPGAASRVEDASKYELLSAVRRVLRGESVLDQECRYAPAS